MQDLTPSSSSSSFATNVLKLTTGSVFAQGLAVLVAPIVARLFAPEAFGVAALFASITGIISVVACLRYQLSIMLAKTDEEASNLLGVSLFFVLIITGASALLIFFADDLIVKLLNSPELKKYLWLTPIAVFVNGVFLALNYWSSRTKHFGRLSIARVVSSVITQAGNLGAGFSGFVSGGVLIVARVLGQFVSTVLLAAQIWRGDHRLFNNNIRSKKMIAGLKRYKKFPIYNTWSALLNTISQFLPILFLAYFFSSKIVGFFAFGLQVLFLPASLIGQAVGQVFFQKASDARNQGQLGVVVEEVFRRLVALGMFPFLVLMFLGKDLFSFIFGPQWSEAGVYVQILCPWVFFTFIFSPLSFLFLILEAQKEALFVDVVFLTSRCIVLTAGGFLGNPNVTVALFSFFGTIIICCLIFFWVFPKTGVAPKKATIILFRYLLISLPALIIIGWSNYIIEFHFLVTLGICFICTILYYTLVLYNDLYMTSQLIVFFRNLPRQAKNNT